MMMGNHVTTGTFMMAPYDFGSLGLAATANVLYDGHDRLMLHEASWPTKASWPIFAADVEVIQGEPNSRPFW